MLCARVLSRYGSGISVLQKRGKHTCTYVCMWSGRWVVTCDAAQQLSSQYGEPMEMSRRVWVLQPASSPAASIYAWFAATYLSCLRSLVHQDGHSSPLLRFLYTYLLLFNCFPRPRKSGQPFSNAVPRRVPPRSSAR